MFSSVFQHLIRDISENGVECKPRDLAVKEQLFTKLPIEERRKLSQLNDKEINEAK